MKHGKSASGWSPPEDWIRILTIDAHAGGEPLRVVIDGFPPLEGTTILERRRFAQARLDDLRRALMWEPRGHADMYGCVLTPPVSPGADFGVLFLHNEGFSTMCGHGIIAVCTVVLETGLVERAEPVTPLAIDTPAGPVQAGANLSDGRVRSVAFRNVPSFALALDSVVEVPGLGTVSYDLAFGGAFYAFVEAKALPLGCEPENASDVRRVGMRIKRAVMDSRSITHPTDPELGFLYGTIFIAAPRGEGTHSRHVCVFADGEIDRSPTGTGVSARLALLHARGEIGPGEQIAVESIIGSRFSGRIVQETTLGPYPAVVPEVEGSAWITGRHEFWIDPADPLKDGMLLDR